MTDTQDTDGRKGDCLFEALDTHFSHLAEAKVLVDLRRYPRFETQFTAEAAAGNGHKTAVTITNISRSGLRLDADRYVLDALFPDYIRKTRYTPTNLQVNFSVPDATNQQRPIKVRCKSVYIRREKQDNWQIGMEFVNFDVGEEALIEYLSRRVNTG